MAWRAERTPSSTASVTIDLILETSRATSSTVAGFSNMSAGMTFSSLIEIFHHSKSPKCSKHPLNSEILGKSFQGVGPFLCGSSLPHARSMPNSDRAEKAWEVMESHEPPIRICEECRVHDWSVL